MSSQPTETTAKRKEPELSSDNMAAVTNESLVAAASLAAEAAAPLVAAAETSNKRPKVDVTKPAVCVAQPVVNKPTCVVEGCTTATQYVHNGFCWRHGANACKTEGCTNIAMKGGVCVKHGANQPKCRTPGCNKNAKKGGLCIAHGAKPKRASCSVEGCIKYAVEGGICIKHGANSRVKAKVEQKISKKQQNAKGAKKKKEEEEEVEAAKDKAALEVAVQAAIAQEVVAQDPPIDPVLELV